ncbi:hypothetical protein LNV09_20530 [Paucibacter sp. B2R-40]|uniref:hypothetical protein n=1 Tax=Paucibacter sp. B2R-40 TaxID=2893554 RepID=UPI0021E38096|nr:hypothetical protein [Paucibacter sp. B2R-40]MCV2356534.1 hypothetical protein [Paucibacter sp. B2R-40]
MNRHQDCGPAPVHMLGGRSANDNLYIAPRPDNLEDAEFHLQQMLDPPIDFECKATAAMGLAACLAELASVLPGAAGLSRLIQPVVQRLEALDPVAASAEAVASFTRRKKYHFQYLCCLQVGLLAQQASLQGQRLVSPLSKMLGAWAVRLMLDGWRPSKHAHSRVQSALARPASRYNRGWSPQQRERAAGEAIYQLRLAISKNPAAAAAMCLAVDDPIVQPEADPTAHFNSRFRRRMLDLLEYKSADGQAGAGGNGTLSRAGLKRAGRELLAAIRAGCHQEIHVAIEILSHLTSDCVQLLPVQLKIEPPPGALAWLDVPGGAYFYTLYKVVEQGARPDVGTEELYEFTSQVVRVQLSPFLAEAIRKAAANVDADFSTVGELLGEVAHGPHDAVAGKGPYRVTASKLQASIPALLLQQGEFRWGVAVATSSPFIVSRGRPAYGVGRQADINAVVGQVYDCLGWPRCADAGDEAILIGSFTTPKSLAVRLALDTLALEADSWTIDEDTVEGVVGCLNSHGTYLSMLLALMYALRNRVVYTIPTLGLRTGTPLKFNDKDVHEFSMPSVPTLPLVHETLQRWESLVRAAIKALGAIETDEALALANVLTSRLVDFESIGWVFTVTAAGTLEAIGAHTWRERLPRKLRLVANFGRQFWPHYLAQLGVPQLDADVLLRHQMPALHPGSSHLCRPEGEIHERLMRVMTVVVDRMDIPVPQALRA